MIHILAVMIIARWNKHILTIIKRAISKLLEVRYPQDVWPLYFFVVYTSRDCLSESLADQAGHNHISMLLLKLNHVSKRGTRPLLCKTHLTNATFSQGKLASL